MESPMLNNASGISLVDNITFDVPETLAEAFIKMDHLLQLIDNPSTINLVSMKHHELCGKLEVNIAPCDEMGSSRPSNLVIESANDLIGEQIDFNLQIGKGFEMAYDLFEYDIWLEYTFLLNNFSETFRTKVIPAKSNKRPIFNYN